MGYNGAKIGANHLLNFDPPNKGFFYFRFQTSESNFVKIGLKWWLWEHGQTGRQTGRQTERQRSHKWSYNLSHAML